MTQALERFACSCHLKYANKFVSPLLVRREDEERHASIGRYSNQLFSVLLFFSNRLSLLGMFVMTFNIIFRTYILNA
jgi:hypothetical protein